MYFVYPLCILGYMTETIANIRTPPLTGDNKAEIILAYRDKLVPIIQLANQFKKSRVAIYKILHQAGIDTSKAIAGHVNTICAQCGTPTRPTRKAFRSSIHHFCSRQCYYAWLRRKDQTNPLITNRHAMKMARRAVSQYFDLHTGMVVHHEDRNEYNNALSNLRVFRSHGDHVQYHRKSGTIIPLWSGLNPGQEITPRSRPILELQPN